MSRLALRAPSAVHRSPWITVFVAVLLSSLCAVPSATALGHTWGVSDAAPAPAAVEPARSTERVGRALQPSLFRTVGKDLVVDPTGDTFGGGVRIDLSVFISLIDDENDLLVLYFDTVSPFSAPDSAAANALGGYIDLDTDQDGTTGDPPFVDNFGQTSSGLGDEFHVDLFTYSSATQDVQLVDDVANVVVGRVEAILGADYMFVYVPLAMIADDGVVDTAVIVGNENDATDFAPNTGSLTSNPQETRLNNERFAVVVNWRDQFDNTGYGRMAVRSDDSANFWFFRESNWEVLLKVLNGCPVNGHYWVFFAATTNVEFTIEVYDLHKPEVAPKVYMNPLGQPANAVTDTRAFATCP